MKARPYLLVGDSVLHAIRGRAETAVRRWLTEWALPAELGVVSVSRGGGNESLEPAVAWQETSGGALLAVSPVLDEELSAALYDDVVCGKETVASDCVSAARESLVASLQSIVMAGGSGREGADASPSSHGWVYLLFALRSAWVRLAAPVECLHVDMTSRPGSVRTPLEASHLVAALEQAPATCEVELGTTELPLGELVGIKPGDVIVLDRSIHQPLLARLPGSSAAFEVHLGRQDNRYAVQVLGVNLK